ncbi:MAG: TlpA family protein disulfide reductase [Chloroflexi bacterium]|nr:TlpA family protein disulfide reductase [Chloroflexota bacterium]
MKHAAELIMSCHTMERIINKQLSEENAVRLRFKKLTPIGCILLLLVACTSKQDEKNTQEDVQSVAVAQVNIVGQISTATSTALPQPVATNTASPTPRQFATLIPTPRKVTVTRLNDSVDPLHPLEVQVGEPIPPISLTDIDGNEYALNNLAGKVVVVNFWTVGCGSCFFEFPILQNAYAQYTGGDLLILAVNVSELVEETRQLGESLQITFPLVVDPQGAVFSHYFGGAVVPTTVVIGRDSRVAEVIIGPLDTSLLTSILAKAGLELGLDSGQVPLG